jgi:hypothetical protein
LCYYVARIFGGEDSEFVLFEGMAFVFRDWDVSSISSRFNLSELNGPGPVSHESLCKFWPVTRPPKISVDQLQRVEGHQFMVICSLFQILGMIEITSFAVEKKIDEFSHTIPDRSDIRRT